MQKFLISILVCILLVSNAFGSPLIFKVRKEITTIDLVELGNFDATRFKQIRIGIKVSGRSQIPPVSKSVAEVELNSAKRELQRKTELLESGNISRADYDIAADRLKIAQLNYDNANENIYPPVSIFGVEGGEAILLATLDEKSLGHSILIDTPPSKISVKVSGKGTYSLYVWGQ